MLFKRLKSSRNPWQSLRARLTLFAVVFLAIALGGFSTYLYQSFVLEIENSFDTGLFNYANDISQGIQIDFFGSLRIDPNIDLDKGKAFPFLAPEAFLQVLDQNGNILVHSKKLGQRGLPFNKPELLESPGRRAVFETWDLKGHDLPDGVTKGHYRMIYYPILRGSPNFVILQVAVPMLMLEQQKDRLRGFLWVGIPITLLIFLILGFYISDRALRPLKLIIAKASTMNASHISERLPVPGNDDELRRLTLTLNGLFERLENAFQSQDRFVSDASHQLRTPLAIMRGELDVLRSKDRTVEETKAFFESASQELMHLSRLVDELLILARVDAGRDSLQFSQVRLDDLLVEAVERLEPLAKRSEIQLRLNLFQNSSPPATEGASSPEGQNLNDNFVTLGDPDLIKTLLQNLIENAIRYSSQAHYVDIRLSAAPKRNVIEITNFGSFIAKEDLPRLFERFSRLSVGQERNPKGVGLGLSIAKRVTEAHSGSLSVTSDPDLGTKFTVELPATV